ncbi:hypothetical protein K438DRAFT_1987574 [Mycena galopus ATCC 62051]|nr:hypothetical protein K438DRAFT_1987574 [Mycena galopus ATCC 62051]
MIPSSKSDPSRNLSDNLKKKKPAELPDPAMIYRFILDQLRNEILSYMPADRWDQLVEKAVEDPKLPSAERVLSRPFTEAHALYSSVFQGDVNYIPLQEDEDGIAMDDAMSPPNDVVEAATELRDNTLWEAVKQHVIMDNDETSCRTAIDLILLSAVTLAQKRIKDDRSIDAVLCERHKLPPSTNAPKLRSWVVVHQEVEIPDQHLLPTLAAYGVLDYMVGVASAQRGLAHHKNGIDQYFKQLYFSDLFTVNAFLTKKVVYTSTLDQQHIRFNMASVKEIKTFSSATSEIQALAQGASLCVLTKRSSVINCLTDGARWKFFCVIKTPDRPKEYASTLASSSTLLSTVKETPKPFKAANTREFNIFIPGDLEIILSLLISSILGPAENFVDAAKGR